MKEWTGTENNEWSWSEGEIIDAAAKGSEMELEVSNGDFGYTSFLGMVRKNHRSDFGVTSDLGRYADMGSIVLHISNLMEMQTMLVLSDSISLTLSGGASTSSAGKMGNGLTLNGVGGSAIGSDDGSLDISTDWSIEAWIKPSEVSTGRTIIALADGDGNEENNELSIHFNSADQLQVCSGGELICAATSETFNADTWYHIAVTHDDSDDQIDIYIDNERVVSNNGFPEFTAAVSNADLIIGKGDESTASAFFAGVIDEVRILDYQSMAFAGGLMISSVAGTFPGSATVTIYNAADSNINLAGVTVMQSSVDDTQC